MTPVRFSHLKLMALSPAHYRHASTTDREPTKAMRIGTIVDRMIFGGPLVTYDGTRRGKEWQAFKSEHAGSEIVTASEVAEARPMADSLRANKLAMHWLSGTHQQRIDWTFCGRECRSTPDSFIHGGCVTDLKSTRCSEPNRFTRDALRMNYHAQLAFYGMALELSVSDPHVIVAVESSAPYTVTVLSLTEAAVEQGRKLCRLWMERLIVCEASGEWPGYAQSVVDLDVPDELELDFGGDVDESEEA